MMMASRNACVLMLLLLLSILSIQYIPTALSFCFIQHTSNNQNRISTYTNVNMKTSQYFISEATKSVPMKPLRATTKDSMNLFSATGTSQWFIRWVNKIRYLYTICRPKLKESRRGYIWIISFFIWWNIIPPRMDVSAAVTAPPTITTKTKSQSFHIEPQTQFAQKKKHHNSDTDTNNDMTKKYQIRLLTGSAVILYTSAIGVMKVNRRNETTSTSNEDQNVQVVENDNMSVSNNQENQSSQNNEANLPWLNPSYDRNNNQSTNTMNSSPIIPPSVQFLSLRNKMNDTTKVAERLIQASSNVNTMNRSNDQDSINDNQTIPKMWFTKNNNGNSSTGSPTSKTTKSRQQPKSIIEEAQLQAKYASIESLEERAYTILVDLGMVETPHDPFDTAWE